MPSTATYSLLSGFLGSGSEDESGSSDAPGRAADDEEEKVQDPKQHHQHHDGQYPEPESDSLEDGDGGGKVPVHFLRKRKKQKDGHFSESESDESDSDRDLGSKATVYFFAKREKHREETLDVSVNVRVDSISDISLQKQTFTGDFWLFLLTAEDVPDARWDQVNNFFDKFKPEKHADHWGGVQNLITAAASTDHPQPYRYFVGKRIGLVWRQILLKKHAWLSIHMRTINQAG